MTEAPQRLVDELHELQTEISDLERNLVKKNLERTDVLDDYEIIQDQVRRQQELLADIEHTFDQLNERLIRLERSRQEESAPVTNFRPLKEPAHPNCPRVNRRTGEVYRD